MSEDVRKVSAAQSQAFCQRILEQVEVPIADAEIVAKCLVEANLRGVDSHGIVRLPVYVRRITAGVINPRASAKVVSETDTTMLLDGQNGLGMVISTQAMDKAIRKAKRKSVGIVVVRKSNHFGIAALYAMQAVESDLIGAALTNAPAAMAPWGSTQPYLGTNPICVAVPAGREKPFVLDMATSMATRGALKIAEKRGEKIPLGWATDSRGRPTQDPQEALQGSLLPIGGPKGYGLALIVDILCGVLSGADFGAHIGDLFGDLSRKQNLGHFFAAIDVASFMPIEDFKKRMDQIITEIKLCRRAEGVQQVFMPGEIEFLTKERRLREGIPVSRATLFELQQLASQVGVDFDLVVLSNEDDSPSSS